MNFFEAMQAMNEGKMVQATDPDFDSIILRRSKIKNIVVMQNEQLLGWSISHCCQQEWRLYQPTIKFKDVPLGHMFQYPKPEKGYGIKVNLTKGNFKRFNVLHLDEVKNFEKCPEGLKEDDSEVIYPV